MLDTVSTAGRHWKSASAAPKVVGAFLAGLGKDMTSIAGRSAAGGLGAGFGFTVGRDAGAAFSKKVGLRR